VQWDTELTTAMGQQPAIVQETEPRPLQQTPSSTSDLCLNHYSPKLRSLDQRGKPATLRNSSDGRKTARCAVFAGAFEAGR